MRELAGRTAFVTGGASGIGLGMATAFARAGMRVALADLDAEALTRAVAQLSALATVEAFELDVRDRAAFARVADRAEERLGPVAVLCNNAGAAIDLPPRRMTYQAWDLTLGVCLGGAVNGIQTLLPRMLERGTPGHVVNTSSQCGLVASHGGRKYMYTTAKFAVVGMSEALHAALVDEQVGVTVLCPGYVATNAAVNGRARLPDHGLDPDLERDLGERLDQLAVELAELGRSPEDVGEEVRQAVQDERLYVHTANRADPVRERTEAIIAAMPVERGHDAAVRHLLDG